MTSPLLEVRHLTVTYKTGAAPLRAVREVSLQIYEGETLGLVGESGCGKSTLALSLLGLLHVGHQVESGEIYFEGKSLLRLGEDSWRRVRGRKIGIAFQDARSSLNPVLTVGEHLIESLRSHQKLTRPQALKRSLDLLSEVRIPEPEIQMKRYSFELSGGMCQRIALAMAICNDPLLLIADEPTSALDPTIQVQILDLLSELRHRHGLALLLITHDLALVAERADRVAVMYHGRLIETGTSAAVFRHPAHPYTRGLIESQPDFYHTRGGNPLSPIPGAPPGPGQEFPGCAFAPRCSLADVRCTEAVPPQHFVGDSHWAECLKAK